jgi:hypothetical protein
MHLRYCYLLEHLSEFKRCQQGKQYLANYYFKELAFTMMMMNNWYWGEAIDLYSIGS